jgi:hypothetical protein
MTAQKIVIPSIPREARSISKRLNKRNNNRFGRTHKEIICVIISASAIRFNHVCRLGFPFEKRNTIKAVKIGANKPEIIPVAILSYFSDIFIF